MTLEELMALADEYAWAYAKYELTLTDEADHLVGIARAALEEALSLTSSFGGL